MREIMESVRIFLAKNLASLTGSLAVMMQVRMQMSYLPSFSGSLLDTGTSNRSGFKK